MMPNIALPATNTTVFMEMPSGLSNNQVRHLVTDEAYLGYAQTRNNLVHFEHNSKALAENATNLAIHLHEIIFALQAIENSENRHQYDSLFPYQQDTQTTREIHEFYHRGILEFKFNLRTHITGIYATAAELNNTMKEKTFSEVRANPNLYENLAVTVTDNFQTQKQATITSLQNEYDQLTIPPEGNRIDLMVYSQDVATAIGQEFPDNIRDFSNINDWLGAEPQVVHPSELRQNANNPNG